MPSGGKPPVTGTEARLDALSSHPEESLHPFLILDQASVKGMVVVIQLEDISGLHLDVHLPAHPLKQQLDRAVPVTLFPLFGVMNQEPVNIRISVVKLPERFLQLPDPPIETLLVNHPAPPQKSTFDRVQFSELYDRFGNGCGQKAGYRSYLAVPGVFLDFAHFQEDSGQKTAHQKDPEAGVSQIDLLDAG